MTKRHAPGAFTRASITRMARSPACGEITIADSCCRATARFGCGLRPENRSAISPALFAASTSARSATITSIIFPSTATATFTASRRGHRRDRRAQLRQAAGRIQSAAQAIPRTRNHLVLRQLGAADVVFLGLLTNFTSDPSRGLLCQHRNAAGFPHGAVHLSEHSTLPAAMPPPPIMNGHITTEYMVSLRIL
jgi:hypothetical protein